MSLLLLLLSLSTIHNGIFVKAFHHSVPTICCSFLWILIISSWALWRRNHAPTLFVSCDNDEHTFEHFFSHLSSWRQHMYYSLSASFASLPISCWHSTVATSMKGSCRKDIFVDSTHCRRDGAYTTTSSIAQVLARFCHWRWLPSSPTSPRRINSVRTLALPFSWLQPACSSPTTCLAGVKSPSSNWIFYFAAITMAFKTPSLTSVHTANLCRTSRCSSISSNVGTFFRLNYWLKPGQCIQAKGIPCLGCVILVGWLRVILCVGHLHQLESLVSSHSRFPFWCLVDHFGAKGSVAYVYYCYQVIRLY